MSGELDVAGIAPTMASLASLSSPPSVVFFPPSKARGQAEMRLPPLSRGILVRPQDQVG